MDNYRDGIRRTQEELLKYPVIQVGDTDCAYDTGLVQPIMANIFGDIEYQYERSLRYLYSQIEYTDDKDLGYKKSVLNDLLIKQLKESYRHTTVSQDLNLVKDTTVAARLLEIQKRNNKVKQSAAWRIHYLNSVEGSAAEREIHALQQLSAYNSLSTQNEIRARKARYFSDARKSQMSMYSQYLKEYQDALNKGH